MPDEDLMPEIAFSGPQSEAVLSYNPGSIFSVSLGIYPEAWRVLTGMDVSEFRNKTVALNSIIDGDFLVMFQGLLASSFSLDAQLLFEGKFEKLWQKLRADKPKASNMLEDWLCRMVAHAAISGIGKGLRQSQRRLKYMTGQNQRELSAYVRMEKLFSVWMQNRQDDGAALAGIATDVGFSDQSHMGRDVKRIIGMSPAKLNRLIDSDESFWFYRLLGERY